MKAFVDQEKCVGCGACAEICPEVFKMEGDKAVVHATPVPEGAEEKCREAEEACAPDAISVQE
ncbi:MAG: ferredoxin [Candidatus Omnitrophica bacterium]|nr:ferredoxin [Candidatus Omnitrophota bacterium]